MFKSHKNTNLGALSTLGLQKEFEPLEALE
jgi:large subunit ribosomal protein L1